MAPDHPVLLYLLHSGGLYGTERMALATAAALNGRCEAVLFAPAGRVHQAAHSQGIASRVVSSVAALPLLMARYLRGARPAWLLTTSVTQALIAHSVGRMTGSVSRHVHVVHGGTDERLSYGRKRVLGSADIPLVAVSPFVRSRLIAHGCREDNIHVIENFLPQPWPPARLYQAPPPLNKVAVVSRLDPIKRVGLLIDALTLYPDLAQLEFHIFGTGLEEHALQTRAAPFANVHWHGFVPDCASHLAQFDVLLHLCAEEPFGLSLLEAFAACVPVLSPNAGGAGDLVQDRHTGFHFAANDARALAQSLRAVRITPTAQRDEITQAALHTLTTRFDATHRIADYAHLLGTP